MKKLLIRADDIGYSEAVTAGILSALESGLVKSAGLMVNMPFTEKSVELIKDRTDICFGLHVNLVIGPACCQDREAVKDLVDGQGRFIASRIRREEFARGLDSMPYAQVCREIEARAERYEALMGRRPEYMDLHGGGERYAYSGGAGHGGALRRSRHSLQRPDDSVGRNAASRLLRERGSVRSVFLKTLPPYSGGSQ